MGISGNFVTYRVAWVFQAKLKCCNHTRGRSTGRGAREAEEVGREARRDGRTRGRGTQKEESRGGARAEGHRSRAGGCRSRHHTATNSAGAAERRDSRHRSEWTAADIELAADGFEVRQAVPRPTVLTVLAPVAFHSPDRANLLGSITNFRVNVPMCTIVTTTSVTRLLRVVCALVIQPQARRRPTGVAATANDEPRLPRRTFRYEGFVQPTFRNTLQPRGAWTAGPFFACLIAVTV